MLYSLVFADDIKYLDTSIDEVKLKHLVEDYLKLKAEEKDGFVAYAKSRGVIVKDVEIYQDIKNIYFTDIHNHAD